MAWTTPNTWTAALVTVAQFNTYIRDNLLAVFPAGPAWSSVTFSAGNFTGNGAQTWTVASGDVTSNKYIECGKTMTWSVQIDTSSVGGTPNTELRATVPNGRTIVGRSFARAALVTDNGTVRDNILVRALSGNTYVSLIRTDLSSNWAASTDNTAVYFTIAFEVA